MPSTSNTQPLDLLPPEEKFWKRYSPHHEMPLSGMTSLVVHFLVLGILVLGSIGIALRQESDFLRPPNMDVVQISGGGGDGGGLEGLGGEPGGFGKTEVALSTTKPGPERPLDSSPLIPIKETSAFELTVPPQLNLSTPTEGSDIFAELDQLKKDADVQAKDPVPEKKVAPISPARQTGNVSMQKKGSGGLGGTGNGPGRGNKSGSGTGTGTGTGTGLGGMPGPPATKQEIFARRWKFGLVGQAKEHAEKLLAMGIILAVPDPRGTDDLLIIQDLKRRPVELRREKITKWKDAVHWFNTAPESVFHLARELKLTWTPKAFILMLPKDREERMAQEEMRFAQEQGNDPKAITETWFDFRLRNGAFEPVAVSQK